MSGAQGYRLGGDADAFLDAEDEQQRDTARLAANTLIWERAGITYRLESALDRYAALPLARGISRE